VGALEHSRLLELVDRRGTSPLSFLLRYDAPWQAHWNGDGAIAYLEGKRAAVAWSDPLCDSAATPALLRSFDEEMRRQKRGVCLIAIGEDTARAALGNGFSLLKVGEEPWFDLSGWQVPVRGDPGKKLRWLLNHARAADVAVFHYGPGFRPPGLEADVEAVLERWRAGLGRPESNSFMRTAPLALPDLKQLFVARRNGVAQAVLACSRLPANETWYLEDLVRAPDAVNGATELLIVTALGLLRADGVSGASFAMAPMRNPRGQIDPRAQWLGWALERVIRQLDRRYRFRAIARYEERFAPTEWRPRYVAFRPVIPRLAVIRAAVRVLG
jgi:phosphatidylglycerol lysyltransferase